MEHLYIVVCRHKQLPDRPWRAQSDGIFTEHRLAANFCECQSVSQPDYVFAIVEGPIVNPAEMAAQEALLPTF